MNLPFKFPVSFLLITCFAGLTMASGIDELLANFANDPDIVAGRTIEVQGRVIAINANGQSLELFDSPSHARISVQLAELSKADRADLILSDVRQVVVRGRASVLKGQLTIHAQSVQAVDQDSEDANDNHH